MGACFSENKKVNPVVKMIDNCQTVNVKNFKILHPIGKGGFGKVYLIERDGV